MPEHRRASDLSCRGPLETVCLGCDVYHVSGTEAFGPLSYITSTGLLMVLPRYI